MSEEEPQPKNVIRVTSEAFRKMGAELELEEQKEALVALVNKARNEYPNLDTVLSKENPDFMKIIKKTELDSLIYTLEYQLFDNNFPAEETIQLCVHELERRLETI